MRYILMYRVLFHPIRHIYIYSISFRPMRYMFIYCILFYPMGYILSIRISKKTKMGLETVAYMASPSKNCRRGLDKNYEKIKVVPLKKGGKYSTHLNIFSGYILYYKHESLKAVIYHKALCSSALYEVNTN